MNNKKLQIFVLSCLLLTGCDGKTVILDNGFKASYIEGKIEECQYIFYDRGISHKGNCTNQIHIYNHQEIPPFPPTSGFLEWNNDLKTWVVRTNIVELGWGWPF